ncbi:flavin reductase family protein [Verticiella sediminum]|uniref:Flavin reductase family protein n=1 Tax=Verticiella sediminum TaxID=1247510 RepID=A0A556AUM3_9BURK|nr:flavin reductase family protein [Verticiella sediminum]TSH96642.1 flavin reductase family protein [Verticiella sediminum]
MSPSTARAPEFDDLAFRRTLGRFPTGVTIITARGADDRPVGLTVSSFNSVSLAPPLVLWSLARRSTSLEVFQTVERYAIHVLASGQASLARQFALPGDRFANVDWSFNADGVPILRDACTAARLECFNRSRYPEGDHIILVGEVERCEHNTQMPLVFHAGGFHLTPGHETP